MSPFLEMEINFFFVPVYKTVILPYTFIIRFMQINSKWDPIFFMPSVISNGLTRINQN